MEGIGDSNATPSVQPGGDDESPRRRHRHHHKHRHHHRHAAAAAAPPPAPVDDIEDMASVLVLSSQGCGDAKRRSVPSTD